MNSNMNRDLIETIVKKALRDVRDSPERNVRNLVDMALLFSTGQFQRQFFEIAQKTLRNEYSAYYPMIRDAAFFVSDQRLLTFGMNLGYNSLIAGADKIRASDMDFHVPWSIAFEIDGASYWKKSSRYVSFIEEGARLGIFSWLVFTGAEPEKALPLAEAYPNHAFAIFCEPEGITSELVAAAESALNVMFVPRWNEETQNACQTLRDARFLYSVYLQYCKEDEDDIFSGEVFSCAENLHPLFTMLYPSADCAWKTRSKVYERILHVRERQQYKTVPWDLYFDGLYIDNAISRAAHAVWFDRDGYFHMIPDRGNETRNLFECALKEILRDALPQAGG